MTSSAEGGEAVSRKVILAYMPVIHRGYIELLARHQDAEMLYVLDRELAIELDRDLRKDVRALSATYAMLCLARRLGPRMGMGVAGQRAIVREIAKPGTTVVMPDEDVSRELAKRYLADCEVQFEPIFLRWDRANVSAEQEIRYDRKVTADGALRKLMGLALRESQKASNWWRQVGAVIARDGEVVLAGYNRHVPSSHMPYLEGDPRTFFKRGVAIELTTDFHAEARLFAEAARRGIPLEGADLYVTTFPCPPCAKLVAYSGIRRCYYLTGYSLVDAERILRTKGVKIILVEMENPGS